MMQTAPSSISVSRLCRALAVTAVLLIAFDQGAGLFLDHVYRNSSRSPLARMTMSGPATLVLGSSTAKYAIDPDAFLPATYNGAANGANLFYVAAIMRNLPRTPNLKRIVIGFDPADFISGYRSPNFKRLWLIAPLGRRDPLLRDWLTLDEPVKRAHFLSGLLLYRGEVVPLIRQWLKPRPLDNGYAPLESAGMTIPGMGAPMLGAAPVAPESAEAVRLIAEAARRLDVQVISVITPMAGRIRESDSLFGNGLAAIRSGLAGARHCDLLGLESADIGSLVLTSGYFLDGAHLTGSGAATYSKILARQIARHCGA